ncbi:phage shock protein operon transcriptional activator [Photobacterium aquimaris]|uniref:Phage shock protein operon transcriptional activator n=1 Tax=Photobacterium aquimaris TaxID=512643 RepID=A0A2T3I024_9GAMM|nr:phage shock protein operon transcriptional activator [Photobacterium aquimaris]MCP4954682.1 phage shock protein operon transcriptional activator [Photobacterium aquimaris]OBU26497.1 phage shock protein operon transcriptional activator [Photobacterium aquimaris]PQJ40755.1 phage shock protein operon transcriptional activator [Photobacterium aquimaris]PSU07958.1 phage shock protein operon transcriptional activator [Photobacterium aquimaris]
MKKTENLIGESDAFLAVLDHASQLATLNRPVLILGERGTGKELIAQRIHYLSARWDQPLISLNCAALADGVIDSELFGHEAGAFTGAKGRHQGRFERAENGTLFLDELATAPMGVQEKLLRVIEYGEYERVGGNKSCQANVRLICATNQNLPQLAAEGKFRADLLDRLAFEVIHLPPLRARIDDILPLAEHYAVRMCREMNFSYFAGFSYQAQQQLLKYSWPGNIRELKNVVERSVFRHAQQDEVIDTIVIDPFTTSWDNVPPLLPSQSTPIKSSQNQEANTLTFPIDLRQQLQQQEIIWIEQALTLAKFNQTKTAELLQLSYHQLRGLIRKYNININGD